MGPIVVGSSEYLVCVLVMFGLTLMIDLSFFNIASWDTCLDVPVYIIIYLVVHATLQ